MPPSCFVVGAEKERHTQRCVIRTVVGRTGNGKSQREQHIRICLARTVAGLPC